jgi:hypothetical protein
VFWVLGTPLILLVGVASALQIPYVQTKVVQRLGEMLTKTTGFITTVDYVSINWFDKIAVEGISVKDLQDSSMFKADEAVIDFTISNITSTYEIVIDEIVLFNADFKMFRNPESARFNIQEYIQTIVAHYKKEGASTRSFVIRTVKLFSTTYTLWDASKPVNENYFDINHFTINNVKSQVDNLTILKDTITMDIKSLSGFNIQNKTEIHSITGLLSIHPSRLKLTELQAAIGKSYISDEIIFNFDGYQSLSDFVPNVNIKTTLKSCVIASEELSLFVPAFSGYSEVFTLSGSVNGKIGDLKIKDLDLALGNQSLIKGDFILNGLPELNDFYFDATISKSRILISDLKDYVPENVYQRISKLNDLFFFGSLNGNIHDFLARGNFESDLGQIDCDLNLKIPRKDSKEIISYKGNLELTDFDIGEFFQDNILQKVSLKGSIDGRGVTLSTAAFKLDGVISEIGINGYNYSDIVTNANFAKEFFDGNIRISDPNLRFNATGSIDLREKKNEIKIHGRIDTLFFEPVGLLPSDLFLRTEFDVNVTGLQVDSLQGRIITKNTMLINPEGQLNLDSLNLFSQRNSAFRLLKVNASDFSVDLQGDFNYTSALRDITALVKEFQLSFKNQSDSLSQYYRFKSEQISKNDYYVDYFINLKDINPLLQFLVPEISVSKNSQIQGRFSSGFTSIFSLSTSIDTVNYQKSSFFDNEIDLSASKISDSTQILAMLYVYSKNQLINELTRTKDMTLDCVWSNNEMDFNATIAHENNLNYADIFGTVNFLKDSTTIHIKPSDILALNENWRIDNDNLIASSGREISVKDLRFFNKNQSIELNGDISEKADKMLTVIIDSVRMENINPLINRNLTGIINGGVRLSDLYHHPLIDSRVEILSMRINDFLVGNIQGRSEWIPQSELFEIDFKVDREEKDIIDVTGLFEPFESENSLNLKAKFSEANLKIIEPFIETIFSNISGTISGEFSITGTPLFPYINGAGIVNDGSLMVNYLNTNYNLAGDIAFTESKIRFQNIQVTDIDNNNAFLSGEFTHNRFRNFSLNLSGNLDNFQVLNTTSKDNDLFYGNAKVTGKVSFNGPLSKLKISANARTNRGTRLFIPLGDTESIEARDYITFVNFSSGEIDSIQGEEKTVNLKGLLLDFDLEITPDAYAEMIFDIQSGDIIRGRGNGKIKLQIDTQGDFAMIGDYEFISGGYNFTLYNIINKEFSILPGSSISWAGDPYRGILDLQASYMQQTSLGPLMDTTVYNHSPESNRRYPTEVLLNLAGPLLSPNIAFDIKVTSYPDIITLDNGQSFSLSSMVSSFENRIASDEQEMKRQVFSLLILRRFSEQEGLLSGSNYIVNSVSEFLSNQLSYWITQLDENLDIDVDLGQLDQEGFNAFQLRLSYTFLEGRLRVTRDGGFTDAENKADFASIAGDWTVEYSLTPEGKFRVKMFNRTNTNQALTTFNQTSNFTAGVSLIHTQSFNEVRDIFNASRKRRLKEIESRDPADTSARKNEDDPLN